MRISETTKSESRSKILRKIKIWDKYLDEYKGEIPDEERIVLIAAPHTSNWDFILAMLAIFGLNIKVRWLG